MGCIRLDILNNWYQKPELTGVLSKNYLTLEKTKKKARRAYRFAFNGQEKDDELKGRGNHNTAEFWQYDTRLGRRWNLDPKPITGISDYATFANNPIWKSDLRGDSTVYYSNQGNRLFVSHDKLENGVTIVNDENVVKLSNHIEFAKNHGINPESKDFNAMLRGLGTTYMTNDMIKFYKQNKNASKAIFAGEEGSGKFRKTQYSEYSIYLYEFNGEARIGGTKRTDRRINYVYLPGSGKSGTEEETPSGFENCGNRISLMHIHVAKRNSSVIVDLDKPNLGNYSTSIQIGGYGPSGGADNSEEGDYDAASGSGLYRNIVIDGKYINLYFDDGNIKKEGHQKNIQIDMKKIFKKSDNSNFKNK